jgi:hypothetical protein
MVEMRDLEFQYHATKAANPDWTKSLWDYLIGLGCTADDIWEYSPSIGHAAGQPEPDWA